MANGFIDKARITVRAGNGGNGAVAFHREKYIAAGDTIIPHSSFLTFPIYLHYSQLYVIIKIIAIKHERTCDN